MKNWVEETYSSTQFFYCPCLFGRNGFHRLLKSPATLCYYYCCHFLTVLSSMSALFVADKSFCFAVPVR